MKRAKVLAVVGARPQFIKAAAIHRALKKSKIKTKPQFIWLNTGQHYDYEMAGVFFNELKLPKFKYHLGARSTKPAFQMARIIEKIHPVILKEKPDWVLVFGDTTSTVAAALGAKNSGVNIAHVEAGLRSFDWRMPEEANRRVTDALSTLLFCPTARAVRELANEGIRKGVHLVGDVMADLLLDHAKSESSNGDAPPYYLATIHRNTNTDQPKRLSKIIHMLNGLDLPVLMPLHPRTRKKLKEQHRLWSSLNHSNIQIMNPVPYGQMITLQRHAQAVITDSGGMQKEAFLLGVPCLTIRESTEWVETIQSGRNILCEPNHREVSRAIKSMGKYKNTQTPFLYGKGNASSKIIQLLVKTPRRKP